MMQKSLGCMRVVIALCVICSQNVNSAFTMDDFFKIVGNAVVTGIVIVVVQGSSAALHRYFNSDMHAKNMEMKEKKMEIDSQRIKIEMEKHNLMMTNSLEKFRQEWCQKVPSDEYSRGLCGLATRAVEEKYRDLVSTSEIISTLENPAKNVTVAGI
jgi:protein tyrosine phosphatase